MIKSITALAIISDGSWALWVILAAIPLIWLVLTYNGLVTLRNRMRNAASGIDVQLKKRHELIPNLVETVRGYMQHERELLERVIQLRGEAAERQIGDPARMEGERGIGACLGRIRAVAEAYPDLKAAGHFTLLMRSLNEIEEQISASRRSYNAAVEQLNNKVEAFPSNLVAGVFGFGLAAFFEAIESERAVPDVRLGTGS
jgi:LemA protein